jgi:hypothetical protein
MRTDGIRRKLLATPSVLLACLLAVGQAFAQPARPASAQPRDATAEVTSLLHEFLVNVTSPAMHQRFWADDVIYVSNAGVVRTKADILKGMKSEEPAAPAQSGAATTAQPAGGYSAEDVVVRQFGDVVVLNFRLVQHASGQPDTSFRNSGVFVRRDGRWQVVSWQATRVAPATGERRHPD